MVAIMCCIVGYVGHDVSRNRVLEGMARLEYRGYDSAGFACLDDKNYISAVKVVGGVDALRQQVDTDGPDGYLGIGHTRWSTHGVVSQENAHPVFDCRGTCAVVHNGIVEHDQVIRQKLLQDGHVLQSQTDSELIAHLLEGQLAEAGISPLEAVRRVASQLEGAYAFVVMVQNVPDQLIVARRRSPLCIGRGADGMFVASDPVAFAGQVSSVIFVPDDTCVAVGRNFLNSITFRGVAVDLEEVPLNMVWDGVGKQGHAHYMLKEIYEQRRIVQNIADEVPREIEALFDSVYGQQLCEVDQLLLFGCGTSLYAAYLAGMMVEQLCGMPVTVRSAADLRDRDVVLHGRFAGCALSQSGETADTVESMRMVQRLGVPVVAIVNRMMSTMARESAGALSLHAGIEVSVASTKTFVAHLVVFYLLAYELAQRRGAVLPVLPAAPRDMVIRAADLLHETLLRQADHIERDIAPRLAQHQHALFIGRGMGHVVALEGALKLKEIAYIFAEAYSAGELKHGPLALVEPGLPIIVCSTLEDAAYRKLVANVQEVKSRRGWVLAFAFEGQHELIAIADDVIIIARPEDPLLGPVVMISSIHYLAYQVAVTLQLPIDKPRNLAKSVTVE